MPNPHISRTAPEAQQESSWTEPKGTLSELIQLSSARAAALRVHTPALERAAGESTCAPSFVDALRGPAVSVIAEIKRRSPSKGDLNPGLSAADRAVVYVRGGAAAISVLTEPTRFGGSIDDLREVVSAVAAPVLRKDFIVDELQILESKAAGASAVLLISRALRPKVLATLAAFALSHRIEPLVEVRTQEELERAVECGVRVIGVNARDLETLVIEESVPRELLRHVPRDVVAVAESGISDRTTVEALAHARADAVLVGSALSIARDGEAAVRGLVGVPRVERAA